MDRCLERLLIDVWKRRQQILALKPKGGNAPLKNDAIWEIYDMYSREDSGAAVTITESGWLTFLRLLADVEDVIRIAPERQYSNADWIALGDGEMGAIYRAASTASAIDPGQRTIAQKMAFDVGMKTAASFLHYRQSKDGARERIYLNLAPSTRGFAFARLLKSMYSGSTRVAGVSNAKVSGVLGKNRADTVVIYMNTGEDAQAVIAILRNYQRLHAGHFRAGVPKMTAPVDGLVGVSRSQEPPHIYVYRRNNQYRSGALNQSYGFFRAGLIYEALRDSKDMQLFSGFLGKVATLFHAAGVDVDAPSLQAPPTYVG